MVVPDRDPDPIADERGGASWWLGRAIVWARLHAIDADPLYRHAALRALDYVMSTQDIETRDLGVHGGIKGSQPVWGRYAFLSYPNWATKFFIDAMWLRKELDDGPARHDPERRV